MVDFGKGVRTKVFSYINEDNVEENIVLRPLTTEYIPLLYSVGKQFPKTESQNIMAELNPDMIKDIITLCEATMKTSYPTIPETTMKEFVACHYLGLFTKIVELNLTV